MGDCIHAHFRSVERHARQCQQCIVHPQASLATASNWRDWFQSLPPPHHWSFIPATQAQYAILKPEDVQARQKKAVSEITSILGLDEDAATRVLRKFKWCAICRVHTIVLWFMVQMKTVWPVE